MRLAYVSSEFPKLSETFVLREMLELERTGHAVRIFSLRRPADAIVHAMAAPLVDRTEYVTSVGRRSAFTMLARTGARDPVGLGRTLSFVRERPGSSLRWSLRKALVLAAGFRRERIEHVHVHFALDAAEHTLLAGMLSGVPYSLHAHAVDIFVHHTLLREKMDHAAFVTTECEYSRRYLLELNPTFPADRLHVLRLGLDEDDFGAKRQAPRANPHPIRWAAVSRLVPKKGLVYLIDALKLLRADGAPIELWIIGDGPEQGELEARSKEHGVEDHVRFMGARDNREVRELLHDVDGFVLPCIIADNGDRDATPTALIEAMAAGLPVVSTRVAGIPEIVPDGAGRLVAERDAAALAAAIRELSELSAAERTHMGDVGRAHVRVHHSLAVETAKLVEWIRSDVARRSSV